MKSSEIDELPNAPYDDNFALNNFWFGIFNLKYEQQSAIEDFGIIRNTQLRLAHRFHQIK